MYNWIEIFFKMMNKCAVLGCNDAASDRVDVFQCTDKDVLYSVLVHIFSKCYKQNIMELFIIQTPYYQN